jgi:hypothetical protein
MNGHATIRSLPTASMKSTPPEPVSSAVALLCRMGSWIGKVFHRGIYDPVWRRWRALGLKPLPIIIAGRRLALPLHYESAKVNGRLIDSKRGPIVSKPA